MVINDEHFMLQALKEAKKAADKGEVPVGAIAVYGGKIISRAHNLVETRKKACEHAEMVVLRKAAAKWGIWRLQGVTIYCTLEPCAMCLGAMWLYRINRLVYGANDLRHGALESFIKLKEMKHPIHNIEFEGGVLAKFASILLKDFFKQRRLENGPKITF